jgi:hypothetical protein
MGEIAAASEQQSDGVEQINGAVEQMNGVTQQVASSSEESARAAEELSSQADRVRELVGSFMHSADPDSAMPHGPRKHGRQAPTTRAYDDARAVPVFGVATASRGGGRSPGRVA